MKQWFLAAILAALATQMTRATAPMPEKVLFQEPFAAQLDKQWSWVRETPEAWRLDNGTLIFRTQPGYLHEHTNDSRNILLRPLPKSDKPLAVEVYMENDPRVQFEHAGILWYADDDNYVSLWKEAVEPPETELLMITEKNAVAEGHPVKTALKGVWLRLVISGNKVTTEYRATEKDEWQVVGESDMPVQGAARVGLMSGGTPKDAERYARFQHFRVLELPAAR